MAITKVDLANVVTGVLPVANGGTGTSTGVAPGGSTTQVQYNNAGAFGGSANLTFDGYQLTVYGITVGRGGAGGAANTAFGNTAIPIAPNSGVTAIGSHAGAVFNTASDTGQSTFVGYYAGAQVSTGTDNTFVGGSVGTNTTTGAKNTAIGSQALQLNTTASNNTAVGYQAGYSNTTATRLTALGNNAGYSNTTGDYNTALGSYALYTNATTTKNTAVGHQALYFNVGNYNTAVGEAALLNNAGGASNTALGNDALKSNTSASNNTAVGYQALYSYQTGGDNVAIGTQAGYSLNGNGNSVFVGRSAGYNATGATNTCVGYQAGNQITTASYCTIIGAYNGWAGNNNMVIISDGQANVRFAYDGNNDAVVNGASVPSATNNPTTNTMSIGGSGWYVALTGANNYWNHSYAGTYYNLRYRGSGVGSIVVNSGSVAYNTTSDYRLKENVQPMTGALDKVARLKPVTYTWKASGEASEGFIAHELAEVCPDAVSGEKDAVEEDGSIKPQGIDTSFLVATLTAAIQELNAKVTALEAQLQAK